MTDMAQDVKVKRVVRKYGAEGYALYNYVLELICRKLDTNSPLPDLEESAADVAGDLGMDTVKVEEIMWYCIEQGLFSHDEVTGRVVAHKIYKFLDTNQTRNAELRRMIKAYHDGLSPTVSDSLRQSQPEEKRIEEKRRDEEAHKKVKHSKAGVPMSSARYSSLCEQWGAPRVDEYIQRAADYADSRGRPYKDYAAAAAAYLRKDYPKGPPQKMGPVQTLADKRRVGFGV